MLEDGQPPERQPTRPPPAVGGRPARERRSPVARLNRTLARRSLPWATAILVAITLFLALVAHMAIAKLLYGTVDSSILISATIVTILVATPICAYAQMIIRQLITSRQALKDLSEKLAATNEREAELRRSAQMRLIDAAEQSREGMVLVDAKGHIVLANSQMARFFPEIAPHLVNGQEFAPLTETTPALMMGPGEGQLQDGRWIRVSRSTTHEGGFLLILSDFSEIKEREASLRDATQQAEAASIAKSNFLTNMSHELRTPLNAIIGFSEIISNQSMGPVANQSYVEYAGDIVKSGRHLLQIINSVLDLARAQAGKMQLRAEEVDIRQAITECVMMMRLEYERAGLVLTVSLCETPLPVAGEPAKLRQIFLNLLSNALKFTEPGGAVAITADLDHDGHIVVSVADTGIGMRAEDLPIAMAPFGQIDNRLTRNHTGTGLGLPMAKQLIELHGGVLEIDSTPGVGTKFTVQFAVLGL